jgi:hypothetical protein
MGDKKIKCIARIAGVRKRLRKEPVEDKNYVSHACIRYN